MAANLPPPWQPDIKSLQIQLTGFLEKDTPTFCKDLWNHCISAQTSPQGIPRELLEAKKNELIKEKVRLSPFNIRGISRLIESSWTPRKPRKRDDGGGRSRIATEEAVERTHTLAAGAAIEASIAGAGASAAAIDRARALPFEVAAPPEIRIAGPSGVPVGMYTFPRSGAVGRGTTSNDAEVGRRPAPSPRTRPPRGLAPGLPAAALDDPMLDL